MNTRQPSANAQFSAFLSRFSPAIAALAKRCLVRLRRVFPGVPQLVYEYSNSLVVSFSPSERGYEGIVALAIHPHQVQLYFDKSLPDPNRRLKGAGTKVRSVVIEAASDLDDDDIQALFKAAIKQSGARFAPTSRNRMIIKSTSQKPKSRKVK